MIVVGGVGAGLRMSPRVLRYDPTGDSWEILTTGELGPAGEGEGGGGRERERRGKGGRVGEWREGGRERENWGGGKEGRREGGVEGEGGEVGKN